MDKCYIHDGGKCAYGEGGGISLKKRNEWGITKSFLLKSGLFKKKISSYRISNTQAIHNLK